MHVGGAERQLGLLAPAQAKSGLDVHVALVHRGRHFQNLLDSGIPVHQIRARGNHDPRIGVRIFDLIRRLEPDVVQSWFRQMDFFAGAAAKLTRRKWVLSERSTAAAYSASVKDRILRARAGARADAIVANSPDGVNYWSDRVGERTRLFVVPNALPLAEIAAAAPVDPFGDSRESVPFILFAGRFTPEKNLPLLLRALSIVARGRPIRTLLCGDGPMHGEMENLTRELGLAGSVTMGGVRSDLWGLMKTAQALVSPSIFEGQPNVVLEAAAAGCPLILSDIGGHRNVADDASALFFPADSDVALAKGILAILGDPHAARQRAINAGRLAEAYSIERAVEGYRRVYETILTRTP